MATFAQTLDGASSAISQLAGVSAYNNAVSASQAADLRDWQVEQNAKAMTFNANEAAKNRNWQELMSNTAHQREVRDLQAAGLNPVLSAMGGNGAATGSGATAAGVTSSGAKGEVDTSVNSALTSLLGSMLQTTQALEAANINARTQEAVADKYTAMDRIIAEISSAAQRYSADQSRAAAKYSADQSRAASQYAADQSRAASQYATDKNSYVARHAADLSYQAQTISSARSLEGTKYSADTSKKAMQNSAWINAGGNVLSSIIGGGSRVLSQYIDSVLGIVDFF